MRKQIGKLNVVSLTAGLVTVLLAAGVTAYAGSAGTGSAGAKLDSNYTLEEMLTYAIEDEYLAQAEYNVIIEEYGVQKPFSNIVNAEDVHISLLEPLFEKYGVSVPDKDWESMATVPTSLEEAYSTGVEAEEKNIAMYESFLKENIPDDVKAVFEKLMNASENHLSAFERQLNGGGFGNANKTNSGMQRGKGVSGFGRTSGSCNGAGSCINN